MSIEIKVPPLGESIEDGTIAAWYKKPGDSIQRDEVFLEIETDKVTLPVPAPADGILKEMRFKQGDIVRPGDVVAVLGKMHAGISTTPSSQSSPDTISSGDQTPLPKESGGIPVPESQISLGESSPSVRRMIQEHRLNPEQIPATGKGRRITKADVVRYLDEMPDKNTTAPPQSLKMPSPEINVSTETDTITAETTETGSIVRLDQRVPMTRLRARIAERLVQVQQEAAILTTFNEVDLQAVSDLRKQYKEAFEKKYQVRLGFMSFFVKASVEALRRFPVVNATVDGKDIIYHDYYDIGIAVASPRGLVVPILRDCGQMGFADIEQSIGNYAGKAKDGTLTMDDLTGGTFSITNGGVFGSMLSTPIINPPQSAILGMHSIQQRPVAIAGQVVIRPMMYLALSYDHRIVDGREAVSFLVTIKEMLSDPGRMLLGV